MAGRMCKSCGYKAVASCTAKVDQLFGMLLPGGKEQVGFVPPHELVGLRERGAVKSYMNFSWCLVCGQIQGDWPTKYGHSHLEKYAENRHWEVILCHEDGNWLSAHFSAKTKEQVEAGLSTVEYRRYPHHIILSREGWDIPDDVYVEEL
jgi:hypothetical protein